MKTIDNALVELNKHLQEVLLDVIGLKLVNKKISDELTAIRTAMSARDGYSTLFEVETLLHQLDASNADLGKVVDELRIAHEVIQLRDADIECLETRIVRMKIALNAKY